MRNIALTKIWNRNKVYYGRYSVVSIEKWISIRQLVPVFFRVSRSPGLRNRNIYDVIRLPIDVLCDVFIFRTKILLFFLRKRDENWFAILNKNTKFLAGNDHVIDIFQMIICCRVHHPSPIIWMKVLYRDHLSSV
jgi:hypothetical protein